MVATKRVLVVDDEDVVCRSYERVLTRSGFEVEKAMSGRQALERVASKDFDVMFADLRMPGMDGLQVVRELRSTHPNMPVVVITGYPSRDTLLEAARLGVSDYLTKPVAPDVLRQAAVQATTEPRWIDPEREARAAPRPGPTPEVPTAPRIPDAMEGAPDCAPVLHEEAPTTGDPAAAGAPPLEPVQDPVQGEPGLLAALLRLAGGLAVSVAYVLFLPLIGFAVLLGLGGKALLARLAKGA
ncbi:MAG: hypothetical protein Fur0037_12330 [Planctomycetota bacterium]